MTLDTRDKEYTERLVKLTDVWWKKIGPQALYGWNLRRLKPGFTLDIGCGIGRNLKHLRGKGVGIDHNRFSVEHARGQGLVAYTTDEFKETEYNQPGRFKSLLLSHVAEHMTYEQYVALLSEFLPLLKPGGRALVFCPQEAGFKSDASHIEFMDFDRLRAAANEAGLLIAREYSFPLPRALGKTFVYNEFVSVARKPTNPAKSPEDQT
jgi:SAM-dependent methyltransferase